ncbi:hypothetical protein WJX72_009496 [[Myrmecia] bisecta]|uniref:Uncharacterized protein n=1 Tax=[Myrmecia] bisecta TaxID=41462 RepID=A0AAW1PXK0_9CHLO
MVDARSPAWREQWDLDGTLEYILSRGYQRITLQFPDELLEHATVVAAELQTACAQRWQLVQVYVLADTSYNSLSVDEVAAQHAAADCVVHYGRASLSPLSRLPAYFVFGRQQLDVASVVSRICDYAKQLDGSGAQKAVLVLPDQPYTHVCAELRRLLGQAGLAVPVVVADVAARQLEPLEDCAMLWLGPDDAPALLLLQLTYNSCHWIMFDPAAQCWQEGLPTEISRTLRKRYYLVEKAKNANIVGILVGTLGVAGYLQAVERLRALAQAAGKKTYTLLMGKPNPAKLANFPEVEVFVMVADPQGMILDSKDFYAPIITPFEAELAWGAQQREWTGAYRLDFNQLLEEQPQAAGQPASGPRFSLLSGGYHADDATSGTEGLTEHVAALAVRDPGGLQLSTGSAGGALVEVKSAAEYLAKRRSYTGLEAPMVGAPAKAVEKAVAGRSGRAAHYDDEPA